MSEYSAEERKQLLRWAHESIRAVLQAQELGVEASPHLSEPRGAFTTLHLNGALRGCIGFIEAIQPLYKAVINTAAAAAFEDPRFTSVTSEEAEHLQIEISVLSPMFPIKPEEVEVGKHGLLVNFHGRRGLLLPQVPVEWGWNREQFLSETCRKAGVPRDAWLRGATFEAFTAEVFGEATPGESLR